MIDGDRVVHEARYPHGVAAVWASITEPAALSAWLMPNDFSAEVGRRFHLDSGSNYGVIEGEVLEVEPLRLLRCRWIIDGTPTTVTVRLQPDGEGTVLHLEHVRLSVGARPEFDGGWAHKLDRDLGLVLSGARGSEHAHMDDGLYRYPDLEQERSARAEGRHGGTDTTERIG
jgi:uncharacterized protein YndB with AHSA1/START domain